MSQSKISEKSVFRTLIGLIFLPLVLGSCDALEVEIDIPICLKKKITEIKNRELVNNPPTQVWEWKVDGKTYYYITSACCDQFNYLYDDQCNVVCAPDGGFSGNGDGNCPQFIGEIVRTLVWEDTRK